MNLLVDANLSPAVAAQLRDAGYDAVHVIDVGLATAIDPDIVDHAEDQGLVIVTVDTDFPMLIALRRASSPSVVLLRGATSSHPTSTPRSSSRTYLPSPTTLRQGPWCHSVPTTCESEASHWPDRRPSGLPLAVPRLPDGRRHQRAGITVPA